MDESRDGHQKRFLKMSYACKKSPTLSHSIGFLSSASTWCINKFVLLQIKHAWCIHWRIDGLQKKKQSINIYASKSIAKNKTPESQISPNSKFTERATVWLPSDCWEVMCKPNRSSFFFFFFFLNVHQRKKVSFCLEDEQVSLELKSTCSRFISALNLASF